MTFASLLIALRSFADNRGTKGRKTVQRYKAGRREKLALASASSNSTIYFVRHDLPQHQLAGRPRDSRIPKARVAYPAGPPPLLVPTGRLTPRAVRQGLRDAAGGPPCPPWPKPAAHAGRRSPPRSILPSWHLPARISSLCGPARGVRLAKSTFWPGIYTLPILVPAVVSVSDMAVPAEAASGPAKNAGRFCRWSPHGPPPSHGFAPNGSTRASRSCRTARYALAVQRWRLPSRYTRSSQSGVAQYDYPTPPALTPCPCVACQQRVPRETLSPPLLFF